MHITEQATLSFSLAGGDEGKRIGKVYSFLLGLGLGYD